MSTASLSLLAASSSAFVIGLIIWRTVPPPRSLRHRLGPYLTPSSAAMRSRKPSGAVASVFGPIVESAAAWLASLLDRSGAQVTPVKLRQAGWYREFDEAEMIASYRIAQLKSVIYAVLTAGVAGQILSMAVVPRLALLILGVVVGASRQRGMVDKAIESRKEIMRVEIYTINQLLAMRVRAGGGVVHAVRAVVNRGQGEVVSELRDALRLHRAGWKASDALRRIAELTPESFCGRTYRLLASAEERGADLAGALLALAEEVRESRREAIKRNATKRRAAMLVPTIAILAPVLILFVAAPLPYLITGWK